MSEVILKVEHISKQYRLGLVGTGTLSHDLKRWFYKLRGKEDPYLKIGDTNDRSKAAESDYVWAIKDINFEVKRGEVLGIIGKNGAGKSTLLKILSRVTSPTTGQIKTKGRIASLLEVGTGFHPELTGKENIYLNGAILGMTKTEIKAKEQEIIEFSGCQRYIDTPVKRYSSGMRVRLAFAVAAFLEPDILVVDEVLAVGDAEFQKKAIGKMQDISKGEGRTVLFVSHNMAAVENLCSKLLIIRDGSIDYFGEIHEGISKYLNDNSQANNVLQENSSLKIEKFYLTSHDKSHLKKISLGKRLKLNFKIRFYVPVESVVLKLEIKDLKDNVVLILNNFHTNNVFNIGDSVINCVCEIEKLQLFPGQYKISIEILDFNDKTTLMYVEDFTDLDVIAGDFYGTGVIPRAKESGVFLTKHKWYISNDFS